MRGEIRCSGSRSCLRMESGQLVSDLGGLDELYVEGDGHVLADQHAAGFERRVPTESEVFAVDFGGSGKADARVAPGVFGGLAHFFDVQRSRAW